MPRFVSRTLAVTSTLLAVGLFAAAGPAAAEEPIDVTGQITDRAGALGSETSRVQAALDDFYATTGRQLFVVYVDDFGELRGQEWAEETSRRSGLGKADVLLAVALEQRSYGYDADSSDFSQADLDKVDRDFILPALREDDWAGAAVGAAEGLTEVIEGSGVPWGLIATGVGVAAIGTGVAVHRSRRRYDHTHPVRDEHGNPVDPAAILTDEELEAAAATALVGVDDALQTSAQELGYAEAQFGDAATAEFRQVIEQGRAKVREAFTLRQQLDDADPETDAERRELHSRILHLCDEVDAALDAQVDRFSEVRDLQSRAPEAIAALRPRLEALTSRIPTVRATWQALQAGHSAGALSPVADNVTRAESLAASAAEQLALADGAVAAGETAAAAVHVRTAEDTTAQAGTLLDAVDTAQADLERSRDAADDALGQVTSTVSSVTTYLETHRGAVGSTARTRLSEAARLLDQARLVLDTDPATAETTLTRAKELVREAQETAEADVAAWRSRSGAGDDLVLGGILADDRRSDSSSRRSPSGWGGSSRSTRRRSSSSRSSSSSRRSRSSSRSSSRRSGGGRSRRSGGGRF